MTLNIQLMTMGSMILGGIYLGMAFDTYRRLLVWQNHPVVKFFSDLLFSLVQTAILFYILYKVNDGQLRIYVFLACLLGFSMYVVLLKRGYIWLLNKLIHLIASIIRGVFALINLVLINPILILINFIYRCLFMIVKGLVIVLNYILFRPLKKVILFCYSLIPTKWQNSGSQMKKKYSIIKNNFIFRWKQWIGKGGND